MMRSVLFPSMMLLGLLGSVQATEYIKHSLCNVQSSNTYCGIRYPTASSSYVSSVPADECLYCNPGYEESDCSLSSSPYKAFEDGETTAGSSCSWNGCGWGGCPAGTTETDSIGCSLTNNEKCCTNINTWKCCYRKSCLEAPLCNSDCNTMCADQRPNGSINIAQINGICYCGGMPSNGGIRAVCNEPESSPPPPLPPTSPQPPPLPSSPPPQTETADTSKNCKCSCCKESYCSASIVASYDADSSSECGAADCRSRFSTLCPASGESGSVSASYSASTTSSSSSTSSLTSDATSLKVCASSLAAVGISLMLAC